jgi:hypothetical protein
MNNTNATSVSNNAMSGNVQPVPCLTLPNYKPITSVPTSFIQRRSAQLPSFDHLKPVLLMPSSHPDMPQLNSNEITGKSSNLYGQYLMETPQTVRSNLVPTVTRETDFSLLADYSTGEQSKITTNQVIYKTTPEMFAQRQQEIWPQQHVQLQQEKQYEENQLLELLNIVQPINTEQLKEDFGFEQADVPFLPVPVFQENVNPPIQMASTSADVQCEGGKQVIIPSYLCVMRVFYILYDIHDI